MSWWCGLDRDALHAAVVARATYFAQQRDRFLDHLGAQLCTDERPSRRHRNEA